MASCLWDGATWKAYHARLRPDVPNNRRIRPGPPPAHLSFQLVDVLARNARSPWQPPDTPNEQLHRVGPMPPAHELVHDDDVLDLLQDDTFRNISYDDDHPDPVEWGENRDMRRRAATTLLLVGINETGEEVCVVVHGFRPGFYVEQSVVRNVTEHRIRACLRRNNITDFQITPEDRTHLYGWRPHKLPSGQYDALRRDKQRFFHITFPNDTISQGAANALQRRLRADVYEKQISVVQQFMRRRDLTMSRWVKVRNPRAPEKRCTISHLEVECDVLDVSLDTERTRSAPMIVCCVDIETDSADGAFPMSSRDPIVSIGTTFHIAGDEEPRLKLMLALHETEDDDTIHIHWFRTEADLLVAWRQILLLLGPVTFLTGWNTTGFDFKYMAERAAIVLPRHSQFWYMSRVIFERTPLRVQQLDSAALGDNTLVYFQCDGVVMLDMMQFVKSNLKYTSYALGFVSKKLLGEDKTKVRLDLEGWGKRTVEQLLATLHDIGAHTAVPVGSIADLVATWDEETIPPGEDLERMHGLLDGLRKPLHKWFRRHNPDDDTRARVEREFRDADIAVGDENYQKLFRLFKMTGPVGARARRKIMLYCATDCDLPIYIMEALSVVSRTVAMSEVSHTSMHQICNGGQQQKVYSLIYRFASKRGFIVPQKDRSDPTSCSVGWDPNMPFQGATVLEPERGFYVNRLDQITVLDFASLYPSIMRSHNLCYTTLVAVLDTQLKREYEAARREERYAGDLRRRMVLFGSLDKMERCDNGVFETVEVGTRTCIWAGVDPKAVKPTPRGILPEILTELLTARGRQKKEMKRYKKQVRQLKDQIAAAEGSDVSPEELANLRKQLRRATEGASNANGRQLALKVSANSVYGFTGVGEHMAKLPNPAVANSVTTFGREMIHDTKHFMEQRGCLVVYGDSVAGSTPMLVRYRGTTVQCLPVEDLVPSHTTWAVTSDGKEFVECDDLETWTDTGWTRVHRLIRHRLGDNGLVRVRTSLGTVDCTTDHSLLRPGGEPVAPRELSAGEPLLHAAPRFQPPPGAERVHPMGKRIYTASEAQTLKDLHVVINNYAIRAQCTFVRTMAPSLRIMVTGQCEALAWTVLLSLTSQLPVAVERIPDTDQFLCCAMDENPSSDDPASVLSVTPLPPSPSSYVYDLTTDNHHFHAGVGSLVVHNTDSVFIRYPPEMNVDTVEKAFHHGLELGEQCTEHLWGKYNWKCERVRSHHDDGTVELETGMVLRPDDENKTWRCHPESPMYRLIQSKLVDLEFEKVYTSFMIKDKKRYVGLKYEGSPNLAPKIDVKGIEYIRRDNCAALRACMAEIVDRTIKKGERDAAPQVVLKLLERLHRETVPIEDLVISKTRRRTYSLRTKPAIWGTHVATPRVVWLDGDRPTRTPSASTGAVFCAPDGRLVRWNRVTGRKDQLRILDETQGLVRSADGSRLMLPVAHAIICRTCAKYGRPAREDAERRLDELAPADRESLDQLFRGLFPRESPRMLVRLLCARSRCRPSDDTVESLCAVCSENLTTQPHLTVVQNQIRRRDFDIVRVGGRVPYVFIASKEEKAYRSVEHPSQITSPNKIDWHYYLENQIKKPLLRLVEYLPGAQQIMDRMHGLADELKARRKKALRGTLNLRDLVVAAADDDGETVREEKKKKKTTPSAERRKRVLPTGQRKKGKKRRIKDGPRGGLLRVLNKNGTA